MRCKLILSIAEFAKMVDYKGKIGIILDFSKLWQAWF